MHLLATKPGVVSDGSEAVDLGQTPGDIVVLSAADTELAALSAARERQSGNQSTLRLANFLQLRHHLSVDVYVDAVVSHARLVVVRILGGAGYWPYGIERSRRPAGTGTSLSPRCRGTTIQIPNWNSSPPWAPTTGTGCGSIWFMAGPPMPIIF